MSVKDRIAQLKLSQVGRVPETPPPSYDQVTNGTVWTKKRPPPPPPPVRPNVPPRPNSTNVPTTNHGPMGNQPDSDGTEAPRPELPSRTPTQSSAGAPSLPPRTPSGPSPALAPRRPSETPSSSDYRLSRRDSNESVSSIATARSSVSGISNATSITSARSVKAPAFDPSALPALPPKRTEEEKQAYYNSGSNCASRRPLKSTFSSPNILPKQNGTTAPPPPRRPSAQPPPALPSRTDTIPERPVRQIEPAPAPAVRPPPAQPPRPRKSPLEMGFNIKSHGPPALPSNRPNSLSATNGTPPPIPASSRPDLSALQASKPKPNTATPAGSSKTPCLHCRDFSAPDQHAARFPRQSVPNQDIGWLAHQLCDPFPSQIDKARAIFTWLHHNIYYDTQAFFSGNLKPSTPQTTLASGYAVCEGYAGLFAALAMKAGLEAVVVGGNGKGFGYTQLKPGDPIPPYNAGHAWNAVKIDGGQWKLLDACWGAGHICGNNNLYKQQFSPEQFTKTNDEFGLDHFPEDPSKQFRNDGRTVSWEEYITGNKRGCGAEFFSGYTSGEGIHEPSFKPAQNPIIHSQQGPTVRFSFQKVCPHWDPFTNGKGAYCLYTLAVENLEGKPNNHIPFETNGDVWWCDLPARDLGRPGQSVRILCVTTFDGRDARGLTIAQYREKQGRVAMSWQFVAKWDVA
jgi:transglutaminase-like putative cysteine protease